MATDRVSRRNRHLDKARAEFAQLERQGVSLAGNAFSSVLLVKGIPNDEELGGSDVCSGRDGTALRAALTALGYAPEDWCALLSTGPGGRPLDAGLFRLAVGTLQPMTVILCDEAAARTFREAYAEELSGLDSLDAALLVPGLVSRVLGMRVLNLGGFEAALGDAHEKQVMWARLKQLPPLGEPY